MLDVNGWELIMLAVVGILVLGPERLPEYAGKLAAGGVQAGSAADQAGLKDGDVILEFEGKKVPDADSLIVAIRARNVGDTVKMKVQRGSQTLDVTMTLQAASS